MKIASPIFGWVVLRIAVCLSLFGTAMVQADDAFPSNSSPPFPSGPLALSGAVVAASDAAGNIAAIPAAYPDKFAWILFARINQEAPTQVKIVGTNLLSHDALWETWADDPWTFPTNPIPSNPPKWPQDGIRFKGLKPPAVGHSSATPAQRGADVGVLKPGGIAAGNVGEEIRRNKVTFDYIINNGLWYQQGVAAFFSKAAAAASNQVSFNQRLVNLPRASIEVKGNWVVIEEKDKPRYHWNYNAEGQLLGLVAFHITSKDLPNWFWCTFEHVDNPGRGDYIGIHDSFGANPPHTPSRTDKLFQNYPAESLTPEVLELLAKSGFKGAWASEWMNYRLKGSQTDFTDTTGRPTLLGNSVTEAGFVPTASCITCHARAAVTAGGTSSFPLFGEVSALPLLGVNQVGTPNPGFSTYNGVPDPSWYFSIAGQLGHPAGAVLQNLQTDFIWAIPFRARAAK
jgi:hypothetical protein